MRSPTRPGGRLSLTATFPPYGAAEPTKTPQDVTDWHGKEVTGTPDSSLYIDTLEISGDKGRTSLLPQDAERESANVSAF